MPGHFIRVTKVAQIEVEEGESFESARERANSIDSEGCLEFDLHFDVLDEHGNVLDVEL